MSKYTDCNITKDKKISSDLGIDSLSMFELCVDIDNKFKICVEDFISQDLTITELAKLISGKNKNNDEFNYSSFPLHRKRTDWLNLNCLKNGQNLIITFLVQDWRILILMKTIFLRQIMKAILTVCG